MNPTWLLFRWIRAPHRHARRVLYTHVQTKSSGSELLDFFGALWVIVQLLFTLAWGLIELAAMLAVAALVPVIMYLLFK